MMKMPINDISIENINTFDKPTGKGRATNDSLNKVREDILAQINSDIPVEYFSDPTFGESWVNLRKRFNEALSTIPPIGEPESLRVDISQMGGRRFNYDYLVRFFTPELVCTKKVEFKFNSTRLDELPQFLSLSANHDIMPDVKYPIFYYTHFLPRIFELLPETIRCEGDDNITCRPDFPLKEDYMKHVGKTNYDCHPLFQYMRKCEFDEKSKKDAIINESIAEYLDQYASTIDLQAFIHKIKESQGDKLFLLYDPATATFRTDTIDTELANLRFKYIKNRNTIVLVCDSYEFHLLLRWRNHKGCLNPAWQISLKIVS